MRHLYRTLFLVFTAVVLLTGCSTSHTFQLLLLVRNKADGTPLSGVNLNLSTNWGNEEHKLDTIYGEWNPSPTTDAAGRFTRNFMVSPYPSDHPHWYLKLTKEGFEPMAVDIKPSPQPRKHDGITPLNVEVEMQPMKQPPR